ncbi:uncharacterized protein A4U43_C05F25510 [Asparagus officinalis]|uniref:Uncharacterized protein n=1 Tax=Asparagus officinalis TaxID=4686 RepID=A0A5P1EUK7_ASPOF|nr:protein PHLOEM PROTEIN 2-LIKE A1-like [Asparagus officinalis]ONK69672.1 uncharacterized protein A4U43_C05F25510 [Asparagus officinalis]
MANVEAIFEQAELISAEDLHQLFVQSKPLTNNSGMRILKEDSSGYKSLMMYARSLSVTWGNDPRYWRWLSLENDIDVEVAQLLDVCWLEVRGNTPMKNLEAGQKYEVMFVLMFLDPSGLEPKATFQLVANGETWERKLSLQNLQPKQWVKVKIGEFVAKEDGGDVIFSLTNYEELNWKRGLIVEGVLIEQRV